MFQSTPSWANMGATFHSERSIEKGSTPKKILGQWSKSLLGDYLHQELQSKKRIVIESGYFVALVPYWAVWPFETIIAPKRHRTSILELTENEVSDYATILQNLTIKYDNLFKTSFPYSAGIHQSPTDGNDNS